MSLDRQFVRKLFGWTSYYRNIEIRQKWLFNNRYDYIYHHKLWGKNQHYVIDTDYDNYAVVYGCDQYFGFFYGKYATLLSREKYVEFPYVKAAKDKLKEIDYNAGEKWVKTGIQCGFDAALTPDEVMLSVFEHQPLWSDYGDKSNTQRAKVLFTGEAAQANVDEFASNFNAALGIFGNVPYGFITQPLQWPDNRYYNKACYWNLGEWYLGEYPSSFSFTGSGCGYDECTPCPNDSNL